MSGGTEAELIKLKNEIDDVRNEYRNFVYTVSHDLSGPFRQIEGFAQIVLVKHTDQFDDKTKRHLGLIVSGAEKGRHILDALLDYSRLDTRAKAFSSVNCQEVIDEVLEELSALVDDKGAEISCNDMPVLVGDRSQLYQVFYNLIHNGLHYQHSDVSPKLSIEAIENEINWQFCIEDNGIGVLDHLREKIFIILRRAVTDKEYSGMGMGLAVARQIVHRHCGRIWIVSEKNVGSSLYFTIAKDLESN